MHLSKIMTLIAIKIEERCPSLAKAFLFFDMDLDQEISRTEFAKGIEKLRVKLNKDDIDRVFEHMDKDRSGTLNYHEFCGFSEEKRRNIDPFDSATSGQRPGHTKNTYSTQELVLNDAASSPYRDFMMKKDY